MGLRLAIGARLEGGLAQHETPVAIAAFDEVLIADFEIDLGMTERAAAPVAGNAGAI